MTRLADGEARPIGLITAAIAGAKLDRKTRALLGRGDSPRTGQPVLRNSYYRGQIEDRVWRRILDGTPRQGKRWTAALLRAAKDLEGKTLAERQEVEPGARNGLLGDVGLQVLEYLLSLVDFRSGRLDPAIATIASAVRKSYSAVHRALCRLREHGFLVWMRRSVPLEEPEPDGPQIKQTSSAYGLMVPEWLKGRFDRMFGKTPAPACDEDRRRLDREEFDRMRGSLSHTEFVAQFAMSIDAKRGGVLSAIARALDARDAQDRGSSGNGQTGGVVPTP